MSRKLTTPPAHVWDRIEKILDEQDGKKYAEELFSDTFIQPESNNRKNFFLGSITGISVILLILLKYSHGLKIN